MSIISTTMIVCKIRLFLERQVTHSSCLFQFIVFFFQDVVFFFIDVVFLFQKRRILFRFAFAFFFFDNCFLGFVFISNEYQIILQKYMLKQKVTIIVARQIGFRNAKKVDFTKRNHNIMTAGALIVFWDMKRYLFSMNFS